jgi:hypothetical protein
MSLLLQPSKVSEDTMVVSPHNNRTGKNTENNDYGSSFVASPGDQSKMNGFP